MCWHLEVITLLGLVYTLRYIIVSTVNLLKTTTFPSFIVMAPLLQANPYKCSRKQDQWFTSAGIQIEYASQSEHENIVPIG